MIATTGGGDEDDAGFLPGHPGITSEPTTEAGATAMATRSRIEGMVAPVEASTVALSVTGPGGISTRAGLVVEAGGIIVTAARPLAGARSITAVEADGTRLPATLVATDQESGLAVVRIPDDLPAANFENTDPEVGRMVMAVALDPARRPVEVPSARVYAGTVTSTGQATGAPSGAGGLATIDVDAPLSSGDVGCPLIDGDGQVTGLLESVERSGPSLLSVFLPGQLVLGVAEQLVDSGEVSHGWLGVRASNATYDTTSQTTTVSEVGPDTTPFGGARLDSFDPDSPAASAGMLPGDVITAVDGGQVQSTVELATRLYAEAPGTVVEITYQRGNSGPFTTWVTLTAAGGGAPVLSSSP
jgi:S1-C subfamily serine protease